MPGRPLSQRSTYAPAVLRARSSDPDTTSFLIRVARLFDTSPEFWRNGQRNWDRWRALHSDPAALAASCGFGLIRNHPFIDGNKRIGFVTANMFLTLNGHEIEAPEPQVVDVTLRVADGSLGESEFAAWIRSVLVPFNP